VNRPMPRAYGLTDAASCYPNALRSPISAARSSGFSLASKRMVSSRMFPVCSSLVFGRFFSLSLQSFCAINSCRAKAMFVSASEVALPAIVRVRQHLVQTLVQTETSASFEPCFPGVSAPPSDVRDAEVAGSNPVAPTFPRNEPFGEDVEGLSHCGAKSYVIETQVRTDDFEDLPFRGTICRKPFLCSAWAESAGGRYRRR